MWVLSNYNNSIVYSPQIVNIASLLLVYTSEEETFEVLSKMIKISAKTDKCLEKFFTFTQTEIGNVVEMASLVIRHKRNDLCEFFSSKGLNLGNTLAELVKDFFIGYLPLTFLTRVLPIFLLEGVKSQVKLIVSLMVNYSEKIMDFESGDFFSYLKQIFLHVCYPEQIIKYSFKIRLTKYSFEKIESTYSDTPAALYYRPQITQKFQILTEHLIEVLWSHLPGIYKHYRPGKLFSSQEHGCSMRTLLRKTQSEQKRTPMLLVILTEFKEVIGVFLDCAIQSSKGYIGDSSSFVFTLKPEVEVYRSTGENNLYANINEEMCSFGGGGNGPALIIDEELLLGQSYVCSTFDNKVLGRTYFNVLECEIIALLS